MTTIEKELREIKKMLRVSVGDHEWMTEKKVKEQYGYGYESLRKFVAAGRISIKRGTSGRMTLYKRSDIEGLFITIPKSIH